MRICFINIFFLAFYSPKSLYIKISEGKNYHSWLCVLIYSLVYVAGSLWLYFKGFPPFENPWIKLPEDIYYLVQSCYIVPLIFLMWILGPGVLHLASKMFGGDGKFDTLFIMTGYSLWAPWYPFIIVDCIHPTPEWLYNTVLGICVLLILRGTTDAAMVEEKIMPSGAMIASVMASVSIGIILFTYIR